MATMPVVGASHVPTGRRRGGPVLFRTWHRGTRNGRSQRVRSYPNLREREKLLPPLAPPDLPRLHPGAPAGRRQGRGISAVQRGVHCPALVCSAGATGSRDPRVLPSTSIAISAATASRAMATAPPLVSGLCRATGP